MLIGFCVLEVKIKKLKIAVQKSDNRLDADMTMIRIQALEWVQGTIQDIILNNVTTDWPVCHNVESLGDPKRYVKFDDLVARREEMLTDQIYRYGGDNRARKEI